MAKGTRSADELLKAVRKHARKQGYTVERLKKRGKGSHSIWVVRDAGGAELGRIGLTGHAGQMTMKVTRSNEKALEGIFGEGWLDK